MLRIAHITDPHLRQAIPGTSRVVQRQSRRMAELFPEALHRLAMFRPDLIAVTGDLVDVPDEWLADPSTADAALMRRDYLFVRETLEATGIPYRIVAGNHDNEAAMWEAFGPMPRDGHVRDWRVVCFDDREAADHVPHRTGESRALLERCLNDGDASPQVHLQHYLVWPVLNEGYPHTYADGPAMADAMSRSGRVRLSLSGHYHTGVEPTGRDGVTFAAAPAFCVAPFAWRVYELDGEAVRCAAGQLA